MGQTWTILKAGLYRSGLKLKKYEFEPSQVKTGRMNWSKIPKCSSMEPIYSPVSPTEVKNLSMRYNLEKSIYTDYKRLNETIFYRNA